jgi:hypothetical protein
VGLGSRPELDALRLRAWAHMLGFGGHWSTKSRRYSTTITVLRRARVAFAKRRRASGGVPLDAWGRPEDDQAVIVVASWVYVGAGYATEGERWLAPPGRVGVDEGHPVPAQPQVQVPGQVRAPVAVAEQGHPRLVARIHDPS